MNEDIINQLERLLLIYERTKELELKRTEMAAKIASDILAQNRKSTLDLLQHFSQFLDPPNKKDD
jgi:hypothetical protein